VTVAAIVQARMGSTRLPGKVLMDLGHGTVLGEVLRRARAVRAVDVVVCATSELAEDDAVAGEAERVGVVAFRGSETDVLARYRGAAEAVKADVILRVTADCPLIDPELCNEVLSRRAEANADYAANNMPPSFPHGLDCEAFTYAALRRADEGTCSPHDREHVTPWLRRESSVARVSIEGPGGHLQEHRWTLDYPEDYIFLREVFAQLPPPPAIPAWCEVVTLLDSQSEIAAINAMWRRA